MRFRHCCLFFSGVHKTSIAEVVIRFSRSTQRFIYQYPILKEWTIRLEKFIVAVQFLWKIQGQFVNVLLYFLEEEENLYFCFVIDFTHNGCISKVRYDEEAWISRYRSPWLMRRRLLFWDKYDEILWIYNSYISYKCLLKKKVKIA